MGRDVVESKFDDIISVQRNISGNVVFFLTAYVTSHNPTLQSSPSKTMECGKETVKLSKTFSGCFLDTVEDAYT
jgi:hypothetical protein